MTKKLLPLFLSLGVVAGAHAQPSHAASPSHTAAAGFPQAVHTSPMNASTVQHTSPVHAQMYAPMRAPMYAKMYAPMVHAQHSRKEIAPQHRELPVKAQPTHSQS